MEQGIYIFLVYKAKLPLSSGDFQKGLIQTADYADQCGADEAHLLIFNRQPNTAWEDKVWQLEENYNERKLSVWGMQPLTY